MPGRGNPGALRGVGAQQPGRRSGSTVRSDAGRLPPRRPFQRLQRRRENQIVLESLVALDGSIRNRPVWPIAGELWEPFGQRGDGGLLTRQEREEHDNGQDLPRRIRRISRSAPPPPPT